MIYANQPLVIDLTLVEDISSLTLAVQYWEPYNFTEDYDGTITSISKVDANNISFTFPADTLNRPGVWRYQLLDTVNNTPWPTEFIKVLERGQ